MSYYLYKLNNIHSYELQERFLNIRSSKIIINRSMNIIKLFELNKYF